MHQKKRLIENIYNKLKNEYNATIIVEYKKIKRLNYKAINQEEKKEIIEGLEKKDKLAYQNKIESLTNNNHQYIPILIFYNHTQPIDIIIIKNNTPIQQFLLNIFNEHDCIKKPPSQ
jgi:hypothetical protein